MRVLIFTEGGGQIGLGHISRCSALYDELDERGIEVQFIIYGTASHLDMIWNKNFRMINWLSVAFLNQYIEESDYCIVDSYLADEDLYKVISKRAKKSLFIDDHARIKYPRGVILNPALSAKSINYPANEENCYLLGLEYIILRKAFVDVQRTAPRIEVKEVLITLGGSDVSDLMRGILKQLSFKYPNIELNVVIGEANKNSDDLKNYKADNIKFYQGISAVEMKNVMVKCDLAITAAGQTIYELLATQTPFIAIKIAENQSNNIVGLKEHKLVEEILDYKAIGFLEVLEGEFEKLLDYNKRIETFNLYAARIDRLGTKRIIDALI